MADMFSAFMTVSSTVFGIARSASRKSAATGTSRKTATVFTTATMSSASRKILTRVNGRKGVLVLVATTATLLRRLVRLPRSVDGRIPAHQAGLRGEPGDLLLDLFRVVLAILVVSNSPFSCEREGELPVDIDPANDGKSAKDDKEDGQPVSFDADPDDP